MIEEILIAIFAILFCVGCAIFFMFRYFKNPEKYDTIQTLICWCFIAFFAFLIFGAVSTIDRELKDRELKKSDQRQVASNRNEELPPHGNSRSTGGESQTDNYQTIRVLSIATTNVSRMVIIDTSEFIARNTKPNIVLSYSESFTKQSSYEIQLATRIGTPLHTLLIPKLEAEYSIQDGKSFHKDITITLEIKPGKTLLYKIVWKEVWLDGVATVLIDEVETTTIPFKLRHSLQAELLEPIEMEE